MPERNPKQVKLFELSVSSEKSGELDAALEGIPKGFDRALSAAINKVLAKGKTAVQRGLTRLLTIKLANLARRVFVRKATANSGTISGTLSIMGRPIGLANFQIKDTRVKTGWGTKASGRGIIATVLRSGTAEVLPNAFVAKGLNGNVHVFQRTKFGGKIGTPAGRFPIATQFSQQLYDLYVNSPLAESVPAGMQEDLPVQVDSQIDRFLST
jgi:hypothetical protein